jgi:hypothetical protein
VSEANKGHKEPRRFLLLLFRSPDLPITRDHPIFSANLRRSAQIRGKGLAMGLSELSILHLNININKDE